MLGHGLTRFLPPAVRGPVRAISERVRRAIAAILLATAYHRHRKERPRAFSGSRVAVLGFLCSPTGLGRGARLMLADMAARHVDVRGFDAAPLLDRTRAGEARAMIRSLADFAPSDIILHLNPPIFEETLVRLPSQLCKATAIIGYWAWELNRLPPFWVARTPFCDEIWTPSQFVADAISASAPNFLGSVRVSPHAIERDPFPRTTREQRAEARKSLDLASDAFVVGTSFSMASNFARKNPIATIDAFTRAFPDLNDSGVHCLIRMLDGGDYPKGEAALRARAAADPRVRILTREDAGIVAFFQALDVYVTLHRGEGYGLNIAEASQASLRVIATGWSISPDLLAMNGVRAVGSRSVPVTDPQDVYTGIAGASWVEPDIDEAAALLREERASS